MRAFNQGAVVRVTVSPWDVYRFNQRWPGSCLEFGYSFTFDSRNGDLVDLTGSGDGTELTALAQDAQNYAARVLKMPSLARR
jgi:hypothetical protein